MIFIPVIPDDGLTEVIGHTSDKGFSFEESTMDVNHGKIFLTLLESTNDWVDVKGVEFISVLIIDSSYSVCGENGDVRGVDVKDVWFRGKIDKPIAEILVKKLFFFNSHTT